MRSPRRWAGPTRRNDGRFHAPRGAPGNRRDDLDPGYGRPWRAAHAAALAARPDVTGVVVIHGTDTLEESAYYLHLAVPGDVPIVFTGATRNASQIGFDGYRNLIGFSLFMGLGLPAYFGGVPEMGFEARKLVIAGAPWLADMINIIGSTGMAVAAIFGLILDNLLPGTPEERGIKS